MLSKVFGELEGACRRFRATSTPPLDACTLGEKMNQGQITISYDEFMRQPRQERLRVFNEVSAENRALLIKTQIERWLAANRPHLSLEQIAVVGEIIPFVVPELYQADRDTAKVEREAEVFCRKLEAVFSREDVVQISNANFADYVPPIENKYH